MRPRPYIVLTVAFISICLTAIGVSEPPILEIKHDLFLFDVSRSMHGKPFRIRKVALQNWVSEHHSGNVTFLSFDTVISVPQTFDLADTSRHKTALAWVKALRVGDAQRTYVWHSCKDALDRVPQFVSPSSTASVGVHVLTDGNDNEHAITLQDVLEKFHAEQQSASSWPGTGNVELKVNYPGDSKPPPSPTPTDSPSPSVPPSPGSTATATATATATVTTSPTATATFTATATPTASKPPVVGADPCASQARPNARVSFAVGEPRVIEDGQFVQFVNQTTPCAESYSWTARPIGSTKALPLTWPFEHWGTSFTNREGKPLAYVVQLTATYGKTPIASPPIALIVNPPPPWWKSFIQQMLGWLGAVVTGLPAVNNFLKGLREYRASRKENDRARATREKADAFRFFFFAAVLFALFIAFVFLSASWAPPSESQASSNKVPVPSGATPSMNVGPGSEKSGATTRQALQSISLPWRVWVPSLIGIVLGLAAVAWVRKSKGFNKFTDRLARPLVSRTQSVVNQMNELKQLCEAGVISENEMPVFRRIILERIRTEYGVDEMADVRPHLPNDFKTLIDTLIEATQENAIAWYHGVTPPGSAPVQAGSQQGATPTHFFINPEECRSQQQPVNPPKVDIYETDAGIVIDIRGADGAFIEKIADARFVISANRSMLIRKLYYLAKGSALGTEQKVDSLVTGLEEKIRTKRRS
jgi:hypothetical protein